jgi:alkylglycerol monooxygenase
MDGRAIALAIPFFFLLIAIELLFDRGRRKRGQEPVYRFADSIGSLSSGIGQQVLQVLAFSVVTVIMYGLVYERTAFLPFDEKSVLAWVGAFVLVDLAYFAYHWASHRVNFFWAMHVVHHSSEEYNLSTALRQSWFTNLTSWLFYVPLAVIGIPPMMFVLCITLNILYQFWIHTRLIDKLGAFEWVFNTPSHHRVHHGIDPQYIDKNYAGVFIIWDRLFGTFTPERSEPSYGTVKPLASFNPFWANVEGFAALVKMSQQTARLSDKLLVWVKPPEWRPADLGGPVVVPEVDRATRQKYDVPEDRRIFGYIAGQFLIVAFVVFALLWFKTTLPTAVVLAAGGVVLAALGSWSGLLERKRWATPLETVRLLALIALSLSIASSFGWAVAIALGAAAVVSLAALVRLPRAVSSVAA